LPHRRQRWVLKRGALNVIKADNGNIFRHAPPCFPQRADRSDCGNIIEGEQRRERFARRKQLSRDTIPTSGEGDPLSSCATSRSLISRPNSFAALAPTPSVFRCPS